MTQALSLYLDALRFAAAFTVFLSHYAAERHSGGLFWQVAPYGRIAVLVFFVLSGFVIAWVAETREQTFEEYGLSRLARLYSVILPAFAITFALDHLAAALVPASGGPGWGQSPAQSLLGYALSAIFLGESWTLSLQPGSNLPFWSLNYEAWYYALFAGAIFLRGWRRVLAVAAAAAAAGPKILVLLPVWLMGVAAWRCRAALSGRWSTALVLGAAAGLIALGPLSGESIFQQAASPWLPPFYSALDYIGGVFAAIGVAALSKAALPMPGPAAQRVIHRLAGTAFGLYLLHYPLLHFFSIVIPGPPDRAARRLSLFALALCGSLALAYPIEQRKRAFKRALRAGLGALRRRRGCDGFKSRDLS